MNVFVAILTVIVNEIHCWTAISETNLNSEKILH